jgi:hypothetical protein
MLTDPGEVAVALERAAISREPFPAEVPPTAYNRRLFEDIRREVDDIEASGRVPDIPPE